MKVIILSAGQGRRLLPLTESTPKCALDVAGKSALRWQLEQISQCDVDEVVIMTGFRASVVEGIAADFAGELRVRTTHNPFYAACDNLGTCWLARPEMNGEFCVLNGDTLFEAAILRRLLASPAERAITLCVDRKDAYDDDDMKVIEVDGELRRVGKTLTDGVNAESIGLMAFRNAGPDIFSSKLDALMRDETSLKRWYLSAVDEIAADGNVGVCDIAGLSWCEIDDQADLAHAATVVVNW
ncbi:MAG: phosphocholine cytidylyltransferase family protein [Pseudomonadota bacterium]